MRFQRSIRALVLSDWRTYRTTIGSSLLRIMVLGAPASFESTSTGKPTWALILTPGEDDLKRKVQLVVAHQTDIGWEIRPLGSTDGSAPVIWSQATGKYKSAFCKNAAKSRVCHRSTKPARKPLLATLPKSPFVSPVFATDP